MDIYIIIPKYPYVRIQLPEDSRIFSETCPKMEMLLFWMIGDLAK